MDTISDSTGEQCAKNETTRQLQGENSGSET